MVQSIQPKLTTAQKAGITTATVAAVALATTAVAYSQGKKINPNSKMLSAIGDGYKVIGKGFNKAFSAAGKTIKKCANATWNWTKKSASATGNFAKKTWGNFTTWVGKMCDNTKKFFSDLKPSKK